MRHKPLSHSNFLTKIPTTGGFTIIIYRMNTPPTCHLTGWSQLAKKPSVTTLRLQSPAAAEDPELLSRALAPLPLPRAPSAQRSLARALFSTQQALVSWHVALRKLHFPSTPQFYL